MAISGSQKALMQCRAGIARSGATRSGYFNPVNTVIRIWHLDAWIDVSKHVVYNGWSLSLNINDELDTATIKLLPSLPFAPLVRSRVEVALGSSGNLEFAGIIISVQRTRNPGPDPRFWYDVQCIDWLAIFDAHLVVAEYPAQSATTTILDIVARFTRGTFTTEGVAPGMPVVQSISIVNERPSTVVRRLTNIVGGGFYIDAFRRLRAWSASIPSPIQESVPVSLTDGLKTLKTFRMMDDASQQRTRLFVEGRRTTTLLGVPVKPQGELPQIPIAEANVIDALSTTGDYVRIGTQLGETMSAFNPVLDTSNNAPGTTVTAEAAAGITVIYVADTSPFPDYGWCQIAGQTVAFTKASATAINLPPQPYYGALAAPVGVGTQVMLLPWILFDPQDRFVGGPSWSPFMRVPSRLQTEGTPVVLGVRKQNQTIAEDIAAREGSDGYYEHLVQDGRYSKEGATTRANAELANFANSLVSYEWETDDLNAAPGRMQHIALVNSGGNSAITVDVRITNVDVTPLLSNHPPRRAVRATQVQPASVLDVWLDDPV